MNMSVRIHSDLEQIQGRLFIHYGDEVIHFERGDKANDNQKVLIKVHPDCRVIVKASPDVSDDDVRSAVKKRARWIHDKLTTFKKQLSDVRSRKYVSGESHFYLGRQHLLKVIVDAESKPQVKLLRGQLQVLVKETNPDRVKTLLSDWYKAKAKEVFQRRLDSLLDKTLWVNERPGIRVLTMQTQWGSCSPKGLLTLNPHLVKAPRDCVDYVILHELCHIAEHNHSERFYRLMNQVMPGWEKVKSKLDANASLYLAK